MQRQTRFLHTSQHSRYIRIKQRNKPIFQHQQKLSYSSILRMINPFSRNQLTQQQKIFLGCMLLIIISASIPVSVASKIDSTTKHTNKQDNHHCLSASAKLIKAMQKEEYPQCDLFPDYAGQTVTDITHEMKTCKENPLGGRPAKICDVFGKTYFMKAIFEKKEMLKEVFNQQLVRDYIGISIPISTVFHEKYGAFFDKYRQARGRTTDFFMASELISGFISAEKFDSKDMKGLAEKIGNLGVAKLAVANTFIEDLCGQNWGYNQNGLVIIDVDSSPSDLQGYLRLAIENLNGDDGRLTLSLSNLRDMLSIYRKMNSKQEPRVNNDVQMTKKFYRTLLKSYIDATKEAIKLVKRQNPDLNPAIPDKNVNNALTSSILEIANKNQHSLRL